MPGFALIHRKIKESPIWFSKPYSKGQAWIDIILEANWKDNIWLVGNTNIPVKRGQFVTSILRLSDRFGWSEKKLSNFFNYLESEQMILQERKNKFTLITICKYDDYQDVNFIIEEQKQNESRTMEEQKQTTNTGNKVNTGKKEKEEKEKEEKIESKIFLETWNEFARKQNLPQIKKLSPIREKAINARSKEKDFDFCLILQKISESSFLLSPENKWFDFDWVINPNNYPKVLEGKYDNKPSGNQNKSVPKQSWFNNYEEYCREMKFRGLDPELESK